jgi:hypothetical protein
MFAPSARSLSSEVCLDESADGFECSISKFVVSSPCPVGAGELPAANTIELIGFASADERPYSVLAVLAFVSAAGEALLGASV